MISRILTGAFRISLITVWVMSFGVANTNHRAQAQDPSKKPGPRRPLPKPPTGSRGFEQGGRDSSSRLIAAGATRGPLKPIAPYEGLAYNPRPFFAWAPSPGTSSYHLTLRDGTESSSPIVYETDVKAALFTYPVDTRHE